MCNPTFDFFGVKMIQTTLPKQMEQFIVTQRVEMAEEYKRISENSIQQEQTAEDKAQFERLRRRLIYNEQLDISTSKR